MLTTASGNLGQMTLRRLRQLRVKLNRLWLAPHFNEDAVGRVLCELAMTIPMDRDKEQELRRCHAAGLGVPETARRTQVPRGLVLSLFFRFAKEPALDVTADLLGDPPAERSALPAFKPWEPVYDDEPVFMEDRREAALPARTNPNAAFTKVFNGSQQQARSRKADASEKNFQARYAANRAGHLIYEGMPCRKCDGTQRRTKTGLCTKCYGVPRGALPAQEVRMTGDFNGGMARPPEWQGPLQPESQTRPIGRPKGAKASSGKPRKVALEAGQVVYQGAPCYKCGGTERRTDSSVCTACYSRPRGAPPLTTAQPEPAPTVTPEASVAPQAPWVPKPRLLSERIVAACRITGANVREFYDGGQGIAESRARIYVLMAMQVAAPYAQVEELCGSVGMSPATAKALAARALSGKLSWYDPVVAERLAWEPAPST